MAPMLKKKVLLMGKSGSGKTSMRNVIFQNTLPSLTHRLGATIDVEQSHQRFLGSVILNLWDCGGQGSFLDSYLSTQKSTIFAHVGVLIYVFDTQETDKEWENDLGYFRQCLAALARFSPDCVTFVLVHKMDLVPAPDRPTYLEAKRKSILTAAGIKCGRIFGTSIWDETLYKAWSHVVHALVPNANQLSKSLSVLRRACGAVEAAVFERTTLLLIAHSDGLREPNDDERTDSSASSPVATPRDSILRIPSTHGSNHSNGDGLYPPLTSFKDAARYQQMAKLPGNRFENVSSIIKIFKLSVPSCSGEQWSGLSMRTPDFTVVIEQLTSSSYVMVLAADDRMTVEAIKMNIQMAHAKFEELQAGLV